MLVAHAPALVRRAVWRTKSKTVAAFGVPDQCPRLSASHHCTTQNRGYSITAAMLTTASFTPTRHLDHSFLDCLRRDWSDRSRNGSGAGSTIENGNDNENGNVSNTRRDPFALIVVNGEVGDFLPALWRNGQSSSQHKQYVAHE